jgi:hypothetical protein
MQPILPLVKKIIYEILVAQVETVERHIGAILEKLEFERKCIFVVLFCA